MAIKNKGLLRNVTVPLLINKVRTNKHKGKGFRSSLFPERLAGVRRAEPLGAGPDKSKVDTTCLVHQPIFIT